ncbi:MAG TPA: N-acetylmuramoyl-L-alanine amidase, partial [Saprospiraceae bacterium]|nr:N-acetylmuramoyl-L-alanine amidase [Saprospiraceae bacterium]
FYHRPDSEPSARLAKKFHQTFLQKYLKVRGQQRYNGTVSPRGLFTLRETNAPVAVYIELGNIRNDWDQQRLVLKNNRQALANWLCEALLAK